MDIQVGDRITYKNETKFDILEKIVITSYEQKQFQIQFNNKCYELIKIERIGINGWYIVYEKEEKKELLTKKEKDFLKKFIEFNNYYIIYIIRVEHTIIFYTDCHYHREEKIEVNNNFFNKLENNRKYTLSELGLED